MSRRTPSWLPLLVVAFLALQGVLPVLPAFAPPIALAEETPTQLASPNADKGVTQVTQPDQTLPSEVPPIAPIPPAEPRLPQGRYTLRLADDGSATRFADLPLAVTGQAGAESGGTTLSLEVLAPDLAAQLSPGARPPASPT